MSFTSSQHDALIQFSFPEDTGLFDKLADKSTPKNAFDQLQTELSCAVLEELYPHLDLVSVKSGAHIDALHVHLVKGRSIVIFEHARLHLVWHSNKVFLKPIPACLFRKVFWDEVNADDYLRRQAVGFMRSYAYLIQHQSDFAIAQREGLLPPVDSAHHLTFPDFEAFICKFRDVPDAQVAPRWHFGQFRLAWLDWAVRLLQPRALQHHRGDMFRRLFYEKQFYQTRQFLAEFGAQLLALFAAVTLILSAMQVALAARPDDPWAVFAKTSAIFSVVVIVFLVAVVVLMSLVWGVVLAFQIGHGFRSRRRRVT